MTAEILRPSFLSKAAREDLASLRSLHNGVSRGVQTPDLEKLNKTLEDFYNEVASGTKSPAKIERRILDMKDMVHCFIYNGVCVVPA